MNCCSGTILGSVTYVLTAPSESAFRIPQSNVPSGPQGQRPWKLIKIKPCVPPGTTEPEPKPTNPETQSRRGEAKV
jgi:hypothetical protein